MNKFVVVRAQHVYGERKLYPVNDNAQGLAAIAGTKTLTPSVLTIAREMGFEVSLYQENPQDIFCENGVKK